MFLALLVSELAKASSEGIDEAFVLCVRRRPEKADPAGLSGCLRARR
jgi:hypothetical protein